MSLTHASVKDEIIELVQCKAADEVFFAPSSIKSNTKPEVELSKNNKQNNKAETLQIAPKSECTKHFIDHDLHSDQVSTNKLSTDEPKMKFDNNKLYDNIMPTFTLPNSNSSQHLNDYDSDIQRIMAKVHNNQLEQTPQNENNERVMTTSPPHHCNNDLNMQRIMTKVHSERYEPEKILRCTFKNNSFEYENPNNQTSTQNTLGSGGNTNNTVAQTLGSDDIGTYEEYQQTQINRVRYRYGVNSLQNSRCTGQQYNAMDSDLMWISPNEAIVRAQVHRENEDE